MRESDHQATPLLLVAPSTDWSRAVAEMEPGWHVVDDPLEALSHADRVGAVALHTALGAPDIERLAPLLQDRCAAGVAIVLLGPVEGRLADTAQRQSIGLSNWLPDPRPGLSTLRRLAKSEPLPDAEQDHGKPRPAPTQAQLDGPGLLRTVRHDNYFAVLGCPIGANRRALENGYHERRRQLSLVPTDALSDAERLEVRSGLEEAWQVLGDEATRELYERALRGRA